MLELFSTVGIMSIAFGLVLFCILMFGYTLYVKALSRNVFRGQARWPFQAVLHVVMYLWFFSFGIHYMLLFWFIECCIGIEIDKINTQQDWRTP